MVYIKKFKCTTEELSANTLKRPNKNQLHFKEEMLIFIKMMNIKTWEH